MPENKRLLTDEDSDWALSWEDIEITKRQDVKTLKAVGEWLGGHCKGYHAGKNGRQFGHFGIFREDIEALKQGKMPDGL